MTTIPLNFIFAGDLKLNEDPPENGEIITVNYDNHSYKCHVANRKINPEGVWDVELVIEAVTPYRAEVKP